MYRRSEWEKNQAKARVLVEFVHVLNESKVSEADLRAAGAESELVAELHAIHELSELTK